MDARHTKEHGLPIADESRNGQLAVWLDTVRDTHYNARRRYWGRSQAAERWRGSILVTLASSVLRTVMAAFLTGRVLEDQRVHTLTASTASTSYGPSDPRVKRVFQQQHLWVWPA